MKKRQLTLSGVFWLIGTGAGSTVLLLSIGVYLAAGNATAAAACLLTGAVLAVWSFVLVQVLQKRLALFTDDVCETIDHMMQGEASGKKISDEDTLLDRIRYQLNRLYQMMQAGKQTIEEQRADLQEMVSDISHQVKTPTTNLKMAAATLLEQELPRSQQEEYLKSMNVQLDKLDFLMSAMVKSSRLETGVIALEKQNAPIYETLAAALGSIFLKAEEKELLVTVDCPEDLVVPHDPKWTAEAFFNLLENAVKYTPAGGSIRVTAVRQEAYTRIDITDTGRGIPECCQAAIFKRFYREPEVHETEGIGLGLYLTREILSKQGGRIHVTSREGEGATFTIFLPHD